MLRYCVRVWCKLIRKWPRNTQISVTGTPTLTGGVECRLGRQKTRFRTNNGCIGLLCTGAYSIHCIYRVTLIGVFLGHFRTNLHETRTQYSNEVPQHRNAAKFQKKMLSKCGILSPKNSCSHSRTNLQLSKINKWCRAHFGHIDVSGLIKHTKTNGQWPPKYVQITVDSNSYASAM